MNPEAKEILDTILAKDQSSLTDEERGFLRARRAYLNDADTKRFADILDGSNDEKSLADLSVPALKKLAAEKEVDVKGLSKKDDLVAALIAAGVTA